MNKKICVVTGATSGIGFETAKELAAQGFCVVLACRDADKAERTRKIIIDSTNNPDVYFICLDLASFASIDSFAFEYKKQFGRLNVLICNAGTFCDRFHTTEQGFEMTIGVNYLGHYYLTQKLLPLILQSGEARIINVSSIVGLLYKMKKGMWDFYGKSRGFRAYNTSKLAQILHTISLNEHLSGSGVTVNALHPGVIGTNIWTGEGFLMKVSKPAMKLIFPSPKKGAKTVIYLASSEDVRGISGKMFANRKVVSYMNGSSDDELRKRLIEATNNAICEVTKCK